MHNCQEEFKVYKRRYAVLLTVVILNISNAALWINYSPVAITVANYYGVPTSKVNWFSLVFLIVTLPFVFLSTFTLNKIGLKGGIYIGAILNCGGAIIRALSTSGIFANRDVQFGVSLGGQVIAAMAQSFLLFIPTKVSQTWFPESQRTISTTFLAMSNPLGIVIAQGTTPFIVHEDEEMIPLNNYIWMSVAVLGMIFTAVCITRAKPKTPPSLSACTGEGDRPPYSQQLKNVFTCLPYLWIFMAIGCGIGLFNTIATLTEQLLCPLGYSDAFGGIINVVMILSGFVGSAILSLYADKMKQFEALVKPAFGIGTLGMIFLMEFFLVPDQKVALIIFSSVFGFFWIGIYPVGLELALENTFPAEETISTAFIFLSGQMHGIIAILIIPALATTRTTKNYNNACDTDELPKNYTYPILIIMIYMAIFASGMIVFMKTKYKRQEADTKKYQIRE